MLYLASKSLRRRQLLEQIGVRFEVVDVDIAEVRATAESPRQYVARVARDKAMAGRSQLRSQGIERAVVLGADTEVVLDDDVFGKPADSLQALAMLRRLAGCTHQVLSAVCCVSDAGDEQAMSISQVRFAAVSDADLADYIAMGEWQGKAGAYAIQGRAAEFISHLDGSYSGVMGLPLFETAQLLRHFDANNG